MRTCKIHYTVPGGGPYTIGRGHFTITITSYSANGALIAFDRMLKRLGLADAGYCVRALD